MEREVNEMSLPEQEPAANIPWEEEPQGVQNLTVEESCGRLCQYLQDILRDADGAQLDVDRLSEPCRELGRELSAFRDLAVELISYSTGLSKGELSQALPDSGSCLYSGLKNLHANLKHLTWQAKQVTKGDYAQHVAHLGEFSEVFNEMTRQLSERRIQLKEEICRARRRAEIINSYTEMLVELLDQRDEWLLVVDQASREIVHCNKGHRDGEGNTAYCEKCRHRLPIQHKLLEWEKTERYQVWEVEEEDKAGCYRIISFPIEWKERPSCVHIVMDITAEKMNARHLSDEIYQDADTGVRNRQFLDEFMGQVLREQQDITLCYLDLEGVADINTSYGQKAGDAYIQNFVEIVRKNFRSGDTFARIQDDKFCLMLTGNVKHLIKRKMDEIRTVFQRDDDRVFSHRCNFRYGIVEVEGASNTLSLDELLEEAKTTVMRQKRKQQREKRGLIDFDNW